MWSHFFPRSPLVGHKRCILGLELLAPQAEIVGILGYLLGLGPLKCPFSKGFVSGFLIFIKSPKSLRGLWPAGKEASSAARPNARVTSPRARCRGSSLPNAVAAPRPGWQGLEGAWAGSAAKTLRA